MAAYSAYTKDKAYKYTVGSEAGQRFIDSAAAGSTMTGGDGSQWTKNGDGSTTIQHNGTAYTAYAHTAGQTANGGNIVRNTGDYRATNLPLANRNAVQLQREPEPGQTGQGTGVSQTGQGVQGAQDVPPAQGTQNAAGSVVKTASAPAAAGVAVPQVQAPQVQAPDLSGLLDQWRSTAQQQAEARADYAVQQGVKELQRAEEDAQPQFQTQRNQISADEARALDNQALYNERRGDRGGIGAAQYASVQNTAARNRFEVNQAQVKLSTDTARQIADLRAQGEFQKADAVLELAQKYLSQLISLEQWAAQFNLSAEQFQVQVAQWNAQFEAQMAGITGYYRGAPTLANQQYQNSLAMQEAGLTGYYQGLPTLANQQYMSNLAMQEAGLTGYYQGQPTLAYQQYQNSLANQNRQLAMQEAGLTGYYNGSPTLGYQQYQDSLASQNRQLAMQEAGLTGYYNGSPTLGYMQYQENSQLTYQKNLADSGIALAQAGIRPSSEQVAAMQSLYGYGQDAVDSLVQYGQLTQYLQSMKGAGGGSGGSGSGGSSGTGFTLSADGGGSTFERMKAAGIDNRTDAKAWIKANVGHNATEAEVTEYLEWLERNPKRTADAGAASSSPGASSPRADELGANYDNIWKNARRMYDNGKSIYEINGYLNRQSDENLTAKGRNKILFSLNEGIREMVRGWSEKNVGNVAKALAYDLHRKFGGSEFPTRQSIYDYVEKEYEAGAINEDEMKYILSGFLE